MDNSKKFIKMCEKVDLGWDGLIGDLCSIDGKAVNIITSAYWHHDLSCNYWEGTLRVDGCKKDIHADEVIPIYRQDQLQEMVKEYIKKQELQYSYLWNLWLSFSEFVMNESYGVNDKNITDVFTSMEQLWLAFVMKIKYNRVWNGEDWINEKL